MIVSRVIRTIRAKAMRKPRKRLYIVANQFVAASYSFAEPRNSGQSEHVTPFVTSRKLDEGGDALGDCFDG